MSFGAICSRGFRFWSAGDAFETMRLLPDHARPYVSCTCEYSRTPRCQSTSQLHAVQSSVVTHHPILYPPGPGTRVNQERRQFAKSSNSTHSVNVSSHLSSFFIVHPPIQSLHYDELLNGPLEHLKPSHIRSWSHYRSPTFPT